MRVAVTTLGCKVNQNDTQSIISLFQRAGHEIVSFSDKADVYIINTCAVTRTSERKSAQAIRRAVAAAPDAIVIGTGCYAQVAPEEVAAIAGVNLVVGMADRPRLVELAEEFRRGRKNRVTVGPVAENSFWVMPPAPTGLERTRATLKIEEGCEQFCSYCIVPYARGRVRSMPPELVLKEFTRLLELGYQEIVLTGIHLGCYGRDLGLNLAGLISRLLEIKGHFRIRLGSLEPTDIDSELSRVIVGNDKICQYLHIPLQSGCDSVLTRMNRDYDSAYYAGLLVRLRQKNPWIGIGTDLIVGFPGESGADFETTRKFVVEQCFSRIHVFRYSPRRGTPAANFPDRIAPGVQEERSGVIQTLVARSGVEFTKKFIGRQVQVLFEESTNQGWSGWSGEYLRVEVKSARQLKNCLAPVTVTDCCGKELAGVIPER